MEPVFLAANQPPAVYRDSGAVARFRGSAGGAPDDGHRPEDWVASTTAQAGQESRGLSALPDGTLLADAVAADPLGWLGPEHLAGYGPRTALLVKLLDAGRRLPVHAHPGDAFARAHLGGHGKTEAWYVVDAPPDGEVWLGFRHAVEAPELAAWVAEQDLNALHGALNRLPVAPGDALLVPAGLPHSVGAGVFVVEVQQPADLSVLLEWRDYAVDGPAEGHLGLGYARALACVDRSRWGGERLAGLRGPGAGGAPRDGGEIFPAAADPYFRAEVYDGDAGGRLGPDFSVLVVLEGEGTLTTDSGHTVTVRAGRTLLVPYGAGNAALTGPVTALRCRPPVPPS